MPIVIQMKWTAATCSCLLMSSTLTSYEQIVNINLIKHWPKVDKIVNLVSIWDLSRNTASVSAVGLMMRHKAKGRGYLWIRNKLLFFYRYWIMSKTTSRDGRWDANVRQSCMWLCCVPSCCNCSCIRHTTLHATCRGDTDPGYGPRLGPHNV